MPSALSAVAASPGPRPPNRAATMTARDPSGNCEYGPRTGSRAERIPTAASAAIPATPYFNAGEGATGTILRSVLRSEEHTSELQSLRHLVCRLLLEKKKNKHR